jgi:hypothetical protein
MKKFLLIKYYAGSPPTGTIVEEEEHVYRATPAKGSSKYRAWYKKSTIESKPRNWEQLE